MLLHQGITGEIYACCVILENTDSTGGEGTGCSSTCHHTCHASTGQHTVGMNSNVFKYALVLMPSAWPRSLPALSAHQTVTVQHNSSAWRRTLGTQPCHATVVQARSLRQNDCLHGSFHHAHRSPWLQTRWWHGRHGPAGVDWPHAPEASRRTCAIDETTQ